MNAALASYSPGLHSYTMPTNGNNASAALKRILTSASAGSTTTSTTTMPTRVSNQPATPLPPTSWTYTETTSMETQPETKTREAMNKSGSSFVPAATKEERTLQWVEESTKRTARSSIDDLRHLWAQQGINVTPGGALTSYNHPAVVGNGTPGAAGMEERVQKVDADSMRAVAVPLAVGNVKFGEAPLAVGNQGGKALSMAAGGGLKYSPGLYRHLVNSGVIGASASPTAGMPHTEGGLRGQRLQLHPGHSVTTTTQPRQRTSSNYQPTTSTQQTSTSTQQTSTSTQQHSTSTQQHSTSQTHRPTTSQTHRPTTSQTHRPTTSQTHRPTTSPHDLSTSEYKPSISHYQPSISPHDLSTSDYKPSISHYQLSTSPHQPSTPHIHHATSQGATLVSSAVSTALRTTHGGVTNGDAASPDLADMMDVSCSDSGDELLREQLLSSCSSSPHSEQVMQNAPSVHTGGEPAGKERLRKQILKRNPHATSTKAKSPKDKLTPEEERRRAVRRQRNKEAAQRCRLRRATLTERLLKEFQDLECKNTGLKYEVRKLEKEQAQLETILQGHVMQCKLKDSDGSSPAPQTL